MQIHRRRREKGPCCRALGEEGRGSGDTQEDGVLGVSHQRLQDMEAVSRDERSGRQRGQMYLGESRQPELTEGGFQAT